jgi:hypothetical protein
MKLIASTTLALALFSAALTASAAAFGAASAATPDALKAALQAAPGCQNFVRADDANMYLGFGPYLLGAEDPRHNIPGEVVVISLANPTKQTILPTLDGAIDAITVDNHLFVLSYDSIEEWDKSTWTRVGLYPTSTIRVPLHYRQHATGFALYNNQFIISHGRVGFSTFDIASRKPVGETVLVPSAQLPDESQARAVVIDGDIAVFALDSYTLVDESAHGKLSFQGLVVYDLKNKTILKQVAGVPEGSEGIYLEGSKVFVNYGYFTWILPRAALNMSSVTRPEQLIFKWGAVKGHPIGKPLYDSVNVYTCFNKEPAAGQSVFLQVPNVIPRADINL